MGGGGSDGGKHAAHLAARAGAVPCAAALYLAKNLLQYYVLLYTDVASYQILKNLNIVSTGILYRLFLQKELSNLQWSALTLLALGCTVAQLSDSSDAVLTTPVAETSPSPVAM